MGLIFICIFLYLFFNSSRDQRRSDLGSKMIIGGIALIFLMPLLEMISGGLVDLVILIGLGALIWHLVQQGKISRSSRSRREKYGWDPKRWDEQNHNTRVYDEVQKAVDAFKKYTARKEEPQQERPRNAFEGRPSGSSSGSSKGNPYYEEAPYMSAENSSLPKRAAKRRRIVENFNRKYDLFLTDQQIQSIVNSSYMSLIWRRELEAMERKYEAVYEWFQGPTAWLRVYMYVFHVQEITSDMQQQETICMYSFESVFSYADTLEGLPLHVRIEEVNKKYFTSFDDASFMIAYRFLESKGLNHEFRSDILHGADPAEDLVKKYETAE